MFSVCLSSFARTFSTLLPQPRSLGCLCLLASSGFHLWATPGKESRVGDRSKLRKELGGCMDGACYVPSRTGQDALPAVPSSSPVGFPEPCPHFANNSFTPWFYTPELHRVSKSSVSLWDQDWCKVRTSCKRLDDGPHWSEWSWREWSKWINSKTGKEAAGWDWGC